MLLEFRRETLVLEVEQKILTDSYGENKMVQKNVIVYMVEHLLNLSMKMVLRLMVHVKQSQVMLIKKIKLNMRDGVNKCQVTGIIIL